MQTALANQAPATSELGSSRRGRAVLRLRDAWQRQPRGAAFVRYLDNFFAQLQSENTRRAYRFAVLEFWDWYELTHASLATPDRVERRDAIAFSEWLSTRAYGLDEDRLKKDPSLALEAAVYAIVRARPGVHIDDIRGALMTRPAFVTTVPGAEAPELRLQIEVTDRSGLDRFLACLVERTLLTRDPTIEELRLRDPTLYLRLGARIDPTIFAYQINPHTNARGAERASTVQARLAALSSLWNYLIESTGENNGQEPLLKVNIWRVSLKKISELVPSHKAATRAKKTPDLPLLHALLETTEPRTFDDVRDRAILLFLFYTGLRVDELVRLKRSDLVSGIVTVIGKGQKTRAFRVPEVALGAVEDLRIKIAELAANAERHAPGAMPRMTQLLTDAAPLFPAVSRWGCNARSERALHEDGLTPQAVSMMLRRRGQAAGIAIDSPAFARLHPHGLRHLAAKTAADTGTPIYVIQAVLGHRSLGTTGVYLEERDPRKLALFPEIAAPPAPAPAAPAPPPVAETFRRVERPERPERRRVVETVGVPVATTAAAVAAPGIVRVTPTAVPIDERLVAIGEVAKLTRELPSAREIALAAKRLDDVYSVDAWGEKAHRQLLHEGVLAKEDRLAHTYIGKTSGLIWWDGATGNLRPQMPIAAPVQFLQAGPHGDLRASLEALWFRRVTGADPKHLPTSAYALLEWVKQAIEMSDEVNSARKVSGARWIPFDDPKSKTLLAKGETPKFFRVHREDKIALWFELRSQTYMGAAGAPGGRIGQAVDKGPKRPAEAPFDWYATVSFAPAAWYDLPDPVAALPDAERAELIDWLLVLTGQPPIDNTLLFKRRAEDLAPSLSRRDLAMLVLLFCAYDDARDAARKAAKDDGRIASRASLDKDPHVLLRAKYVDETVAALTGGTLSPPFHIQEAVFERVQARKRGEIKLEQAREAGEELPEEGATRESRSEHYLRVLDKLFGKTAASDPVLRLYSLCAKSQRLAVATFVGGEYREFFRIDPKTRLIVHTDDYKDEFARLTGADSECVARRVARHLWEQKRAGKMKHFDKHPSDLLWQLNTWAFYKVPCPAVMEEGLAARLKRLGKDSAAALFALLRRESPGAPEEQKAATEHEHRAELPFAAEFEEAEARRGREETEEEYAKTVPTEQPGTGEESAGEMSGMELLRSHQVVAWGPKKKGVEEARAPEPLRVLTAEEKAAAVALRAKEEAARVQAPRALPMKPPPRRASFQQNAAAAAVYLANARTLVPGPVTLLIWIYS